MLFVLIFHGIVHNPGHVFEIFNNTFVFSKYIQCILCVQMVGTTVTVEPILQMNFQICRSKIVAELLFA